MIRQLRSFKRRGTRMLYVHVLPPTRRIQFCIYSLPGGVIFMLWHVDQVTSLYDQVKEISNTTYYLGVKTWQSSLAILNQSFEPSQILTVQIQ